jgi:hypothetical protein
MHFVPDASYFPYWFSCLAHTHTHAAGVLLLMF